MKSIFIFCILLFLCSTLTKAQDVGAQTGLAFISNGKFNPTLGLHWNDKVFKQTIQYGFNLHAPIVFKSDKEYADAINPVGVTDRTELSYQDKVKLLDIYCLYRYFIWGKSKDAGGLLGLGGITLGFEYSKLVPGYYDSNVFKPSQHFNDRSRFMVQPCINLGVGYDIELKNKNILGFQLPVYFNAKKLTHTPLDDASSDHALTVISVKATYTLTNGGHVDHKSNDVPTNK